MAISNGILKMTGGFGEFSCYSVTGSNKMIVRKKGGPSAERMKSGPEFELVRKHQKEWKACVKFSKNLKQAFGEVYRLADYNLSPVWNGLGKNIQKADTVALLGERNLKISEFKSELQGFNLNRNTQLNALFGIHPVLEINCNEFVASAKFPAINSSRDVLNVRKFPFFRLKISLGIISDILFKPNQQGGTYYSEHLWADGVSTSSTSAWLSTNAVIPEFELTTQFDEYYRTQEKSNLTYILSIGLEFGIVGFGGKIEAAKYAGAGKCMLVK